MKAFFFPRCEAALALFVVAHSAVKEVSPDSYVIVISVDILPVRGYHSFFLYPNPVPAVRVGDSILARTLLLLMKTSGDVDLKGP